MQRYVAVFSLVLFAGKLWAWFLTNSVTILTDALESIVNVIAGFIGLYSVTLAAKPRDTNHPYGHSKVEFVSSAIEGVLIFISGLMIVYEAVMQLVDPQMIHRLDWGIIIISATGAINFFLGSVAVRTGLKHRSLTVESAGRHLQTDAYSTLAVVAGLLLLRMTDWRWLDSVVALAFSIVILVTGYRVIRRSLAGIMDEADETLIQDVVHVLQRYRKSQWIDLHNLRVIRFGNVMHVDAHMTLPWYYEVREAETEIHELEALIRREFGNAVELFVHIDACMPYQCKLCALDTCTVRRETFSGQVRWTLSNVWEDSKHGKEVDTV